MELKAVLVIMLVAVALIMLLMWGVWKWHSPFNCDSNSKRTSRVY